jgi:hypothetical protein
MKKYLKRNEKLVLQTWDIEKVGSEMSLSKTSDSVTEYVPSFHYSPLTYLVHAAARDHSFLW